MIQTVFAWLLVGVILVAGYPWADWLLRRAPDADGLWLRAVVALGLSSGTLTLLMFWEALLGISFSLLPILLPYFALMLPGWWLWWRSTNRSFTFKKPIFKRPFSIQHLVVAAITLIALAVLFNAAYWPFHKDDVLGIYGRYSKLMYESGALVPFAGRDDAFYQAYPIYIPLTYTFSFIASGWENEYLARVIPALLALACLPAAYLLGKRIYNPQAGLLAALLLALTPSFVRWASSGYTDLPMAFFYILTALFAWRLWEHDHPIDAFLTGGTIGLAAWTKNAALPGIFFLGLWLVYALLMRRIRLQHVAIAAVVCGAIAAPWYIRNWFEARLIMPPTAWTDQAQRTVANLLVFISKPENFALTGWLVIFGVVAAAYGLIKRRPPFQARILLFALTIPFFAVWWLLVSYDPRFLLLFLPLLVVMAAGEVEHLWNRLPAMWSSRASLPLLAIMLALAIYMVWSSIEFKVEIARTPLMGDEAKKAIVLNKPGD